MRAEIIAVGSELLGPDRSDTNSLWITDQLQLLGIELAAKAVVGDDPERLSAAFRQALTHAELVLATGGLGPTEDDVTREALARALERQLRFEPALWDEIVTRFQQWGRTASENNRRQAYVIEGAESLPNPHGTARGQWLSWNSRHIVLLPGPPRELKPMMLEHVVPRLRQLSGGKQRVRQVLRVFGLGESALDEQLAPIYRRHPEVLVTVLFSPLDLELHLSADDDRLLEPMVREVLEQLGPTCYATGSTSLARVVVEGLLQSHRTLSLAESLTCGLTGSLLSEVAGASGCLKGGWMTYTDDMKRDCLGVPEGLLQQHGAVSEAVARAMAEGARQRAGSNFALALTGFAGPGGGTEEHPVGTCFVALASAQGTQVRRHRLVGDREMVRLRAAQSALDMVRRELARGDSGSMA